MELEQLKKPLSSVASEPQKNQAFVSSMPETRKPATPAQLQRAKSKLERDRAAIQRQSEQTSAQRSILITTHSEARIGRVEAQAKIQRLSDQKSQQQFFSSFTKTPLQRKSLESIKLSGMATSSLRGQYQAAIIPEIIQRLVSSQMQSQASVALAPNALNTRADWFNTDLPVLRARHNNPDQPDWDTAPVFKTSDARAQDLGRTYTAQRLASDLTPKDAANAILGIQRSQDRHHALKGMLSTLNPRQSDYTKIQRLVMAGEANFELQRFAIEEAVTPQALQLAKEAANPTEANSGISQQIKAKLGAGIGLPENIRQQLEAGLNTDLSSVRLHIDSQADKLAKSVNALAFTSGKDIFFQAGMYDPNTKSGYELIAHEVTHTVQQANGQVKPGIDTDSSLEAAAQAKGSELAAKFDPNTKPKPQETGRIARASTSNLSTGFSNVQRMPYMSLALQDSKLAFQRQAAPTTRKIGNLEGLAQSAPMFGAPVQRSSDGTIIQRAWWNPLDWLKGLSHAAKSAAGWVGNKFMDGLQWMGEEAAKKFIEVFVVAARPFGEIGKQVLRGLQNIGSGLIAVIRDPSQFIRTLVEGAQLGLVNFFKNAPKHLSSAIGEFLGAQGLSFTFPRAFDAHSILMAFVSSLGLGWSSIRAKIAKKLGPNGGQAIAQAEKTIPLIQEFSGGIGKSKTFKDAFLPVIQQEAVDGIKTAAQETMIRSALNLLLKIMPGAGTISTIFETVSFFVERFGRVKNLMGNVLNAFKAVAAGNPVGVANAIEYSFANSMVLVLGLFAKITRIDGFLKKIRNIIQSVTSKIHKYVDSVVEWAVKGLRPLVDKLSKINSGKTIKPGSSKPVPAPSLVRTSKPASSKPTTKPESQNTSQTPQALELNLSAPIRPHNQKPHTLILKGKSTNAVLMIYSNPKTFTEFVSKIKTNFHPTSSSRLAIELINAEKIAAKLQQAERASRKVGDTSYTKMVGFMNSLAKTIENILEYAGTNPPSVVEYGGLNSGHQATWMKAKILSSNFVKGSVPEEESMVMTTIKTNRNLGRNTKYVLGHLLNHNLGGKGDAYNLTVLSRTANKSHESLVESPVKAAITSGRVLEYIVRPDYSMKIPMTPNQRNLQTQMTTLTANHGNPSQLREITRKFNIMEYERKNLAFRLQTSWQVLGFDNDELKWKATAAKNVTDIANSLDPDEPA